MKLPLYLQRLAREVNKSCFAIPMRMLGNVDLMVGNSSSGIMETASLALPTVNVGVRQYGRERARNVLDAEANKQSILEKLEEARSHRFKSSLEGMTNP